MPLDTQIDGSRSVFQRVQRFSDAIFDNPAVVQMPARSVRGVDGGMRVCSEASHPDAQ